MERFVGVCPAIVAELVEVTSFSTSAVRWKRIIPVAPRCGGSCITALHAQLRPLIASDLTAKIDGLALLFECACEAFVAYTADTPILAVSLDVLVLVCHMAFISPVRPSPWAANCTSDRQLLVCNFSNDS